MSSAERAPRILCAGIIVLDEVFRVDEFPQPDGKVQAKGFFVVNGGCAANAAVAITRLGGRAALAGPMGGPVWTKMAIACSRLWRARTSTARPVSASTDSARRFRRSS
jgi:sugar/nucleoside kinase (ribokinase family)